ncbi:MAG: rhamnulokinase [Candidatus Dormibacteraceae bacterium]
MLAIDLGAESGRAVLGTFDGSRLSLKEIQRFANLPVRVRGTLHWDALGLFGSILGSLRDASEGSGQLASIGVDAWGVDFGLLDARGQLLGNPVHYRDRRTDGMLEVAFGLVPKEEIYARTGIQFLPFNSLYQLLAMAVNQDPQLALTHSFLTVPSLFSYWLSGVAACELTSASTTQCLDVRSGEWATDLLDRLGIPNRIFGDLVPPGTVLGNVDRLVAESSVSAATRVIAPATHDTASAVAAVPFRTAQQAAFISSGTWSLVGVEVEEPVIEPRTLAGNLTNEIGVSGTVRLLRNVMGLWLVQECRRSWAAQGRVIGYEDLAKLAEGAAALTAVIDPDDDQLLFPGETPMKIIEQCRLTGQPEPASPGEVVRVILDSLALKYRWVLDRLEAIIGREISIVHIVGGGASNRLLCQLTANACERPVLAGPVEAAATGNLLLQAMALGHLSSLAEARALVSASFQVQLYEPTDRDNWAGARERFRKVLEERGKR